MVDVTPHSLGTGCLDNQDFLYNEILIPRNTPLPATASRVFYKVYNEQATIKISVYQGESREVSKNKFLGEFILDGLGNSPNKDIHIKYQLDRSGLLHVTATDISSGKKADHTFKRVSGARVQHADMSQLSNVKIIVEQQTEEPEKDSDDTQFWDSLEEEVEFADENDEEENYFEANDLLARSQKLLESSDLQENDREELLAVLESAKNSDQSSIKRLNDLVYFLE